MKKTGIGMGILLLVFFVSQFNSYGQYDVAAKNILDKVANKTKTHKTIKASFTNSLVNDVEDFSESFEGTIFIKDNKYKLEIMETETYFDGKTKWVYIIDSDEVNISSVEKGDENVENELLNDPTKIFTIYEDDFKYMLLEDKVVDGRNVNVIDLVPESLEKNYSRIRLFVDSKKSELYSIKYFSKDGNNYIFTINTFEVNLNLDDTFFIFNEKEHPDVEIIDLRE